MPGWAPARRLLGSARADLALALVLSAVSALDVVLSGFEPVTAVSAAVGTLPLAGRRRAPMVAASAVLAAVLLQRVSGASMESLFALSSFKFAGLLAAYTAAAYGSAPRAVVGGLLVALGVSLELRWTNAPTDQVTQTAATFVLPWLAGRMVRVHRRRADQLRALTAWLERERAASGSLAVAEERTRMARELHDAIAHVVTLMVVQAAAAEALLASAPARSRKALRLVQSAGREAITELRAMLRILRAPDDERRPARPPAELALPPPPARARLTWPLWLDSGLALVCLAAAEATVLSERSYGDLERLVSVLLMVVATLPLAVRRRFPVTVVATAFGAVVIQQLIVHPAGDTPTTLSIPPLIALYTVAAHAPGRRALAAASVSLLVAWIATTLISGGVVPWDLVDLASFVAVPVLCGRAVGVHRRQGEQLRTLTTRLERERAALARLAVVEERTRVARDLHDTIAHGLSIMVLQAGGAEQVLTSDPDRARHAVRAIQDNGRSVVDELQRLLAVLRPDEGDGPRAPRPGVGQLDELVAHVRDAGLPVELRFEGRRMRLPVGIDVSTYRIIQEGLTNALKHAGPVATAVTLRYQPRAVTVEIRNAAGTGHALPTAAGGHGLMGIRERVAMYGGDLEAGPSPAGGYTLQARLPLERDGT
jgi:signal transduction histidine kinase